MVKDAKRLAKRENRTMSDLFREALRHYKAHRAGDALSSLAPAEQFDQQWVMGIIADSKKNSLTPEEIQASSRNLAAYGARQARKLGFKESDAVSLIHEFRAKREA